jgi:hypothetical protein
MVSKRRKLFVLLLAGAGLAGVLAAPRPMPSFCRVLADAAEPLRARL